MCDNGKMRPVETIPGMREKGIEESDGRVNSALPSLLATPTFQPPV
jgi:hypothetical protein